MEPVRVIPQGDTEDHGENTIALFLGLYLLVLAFFILLVTMSTRTEIKSKAVMDSLTSTFSTLLPPRTDLTALTTKEGDVIAARQFQDDIAGIFTTAIKVERITVVQPGRLMRVVLLADTLFFTGKARLRGGQLDFLDRLVTTLSNRPQGLRFDMEFVIGSNRATGKKSPGGKSLALSRAESFARDMESRGAPPDSLAVGLKPGNPEKITLWFYVRGGDEGRLDFFGAEAEKGEGAR